MTDQPADDPIGTEPPELLDAMLAMIRRKGCEAARVTGYRERSYNMGYCETCSEMTADVRVYYVRPDGAEAHYQCDFTGLAELIRELADDPGQRKAWDETAKHEPDEERWDRFDVHSFDEESAP